jgi:large subunit ribosomal protein L4e
LDYADQHLFSSLPTAKISNPDVTRLINSSEIQSVVRPANAKLHKRPWTQHKNPLRNKAVLFRLNPYAKTIRRQELRALPFLPVILLPQC